MGTTRTTFLARVATLVATAFCGTAAMAGPIGLIDDFSDASLAEYTLTKVLDQNAGTSNVSFSSPSGTLQVVSNGATGAEQVLFLRDDYSLSVGQTLLADVSGNGTGWDRDLGIAVGYTKTPAGLGNPQAGDVRSSYVEVSYRSNNQVVSFARNGAANGASGQEFAGTNYGGVSFTGYVNSLFITRLTANTYDVGWIAGTVKHSLTNNNGVIMPYTITDANVPGAAVGFYADVRTTLAASPVQLDNLRIIPEPASWLMGIMGLIGALPLWKRRARA
jgi:hypothetical protein